MDTVNRSSVTPAKTRLARTFAKVLNIQAVTGIDGLQKAKSREKTKRDSQTKHASTDPSLDSENEKLRDRLAHEAFLAKLFGSLSAIKAAYAQMQFAQSPYDADGIQSSDQTIVSELKNLSEMKHRYLKRQIDEGSPEKALASAEIQEQRSLLKTYEVSIKKLDFQLKLKDSEITFLREKLVEAITETRLLEKKLNSTRVPIPSSDVKTSHFVAYHREAIKSIRAFVRLLVREMESAGWDLDAAAGSAGPGVSFWKRAHKCFAFESYVCMRMFDGFGPAQPGPEKLEAFASFAEVRSAGPAADYLRRRPDSPFASFCRERYLEVVHPRMEASLFGDSGRRDLVVGFGWPETGFFSAFCEMARGVWLLRCLGSCLGEVTIFRAGKGSRFSEIYMESLSDEAFAAVAGGGTGSEPRVAFTVVPGFRVGKTVVQCQVYLY